MSELKELIAKAKQKDVKAMEELFAMTEEKGEYYWID